MSLAYIDPKLKINKNIPYIDIKLEINNHAITYTKGLEIINDQTQKY